ncbi:MAG: Asp-tRNA(Asn)/Glu-tRNA(Gln) amidotransferase subunit GatC [Elusimicrobia bacterium]|nr:Asp-tRNA(Asn)/Glu-tRNA(Gln) amidotransferase subunit GatC [Elusimicrobiota bacterium]
MDKKVIDKKDVEYLGNLARISLSEDEKEKLYADLEKILGYVSQLEKVDTENVEPTYHVLPVKNVFRKDKVKESFSKEEILKNATERKGDFFKVPKII